MNVANNIKPFRFEHAGLSSREGGSGSNFDRSTPTAPIFATYDVLNPPNEVSGFFLPHHLAIPVAVNAATGNATPRKVLGLEVF